MGFLDLLRAPKREDVTSGVLRDAISQAEAEGIKAAADIERLNTARAMTLLAAGDEELDQIEQGLKKAYRTADRIDLAVVELRRRLEQAEAVERAAALDVAYERGERALARGVAIIRKEYLPRAQALAKLAAELEEQIETVKTVNQQLAEAGDGRRVASIERTARPLNHPALENFIGMVEELRLPHPERPFHDLWPDLNRNPVIFGSETMPPECWSKP